MRREPQLILPNLYLGPFQTSKQLDKMKSLGITHMCVARYPDVDKTVVGSHEAAGWKDTC